METRKTYLVRLDLKTWRRIRALAKQRECSRLRIVREAVAAAFPAEPRKETRCG
jgi:predicted transcriptional regulator